MISNSIQNRIISHWTKALWQIVNPDIIAEHHFLSRNSQLWNDRNENQRYRNQCEVNGIPDTHRRELSGDGQFDENANVFRQAVAYL
ncbi:MAG: hypothetical protein EOP04_22125 [Proteobacteria bacterium]|nr:MAG: hypothetical protein EOP04_22125 [Pseudomonadota bacterium]